MSDQRSRQLQHVAHQLEMQYSPEDQWGLHTMLKDFQLFSKGRGPRITNMVWQQDGMLQLETRIFDYRYTVSTGKSRRAVKQTVFFVQSKKLALPQFLLKPEHFFHKLGQWLGLQQDIDFERYPGFSKQYLLRGDDEEYIRASFPEEALQFFTIEKNWALEGINYYLIFYRKNHLMPPAQIIEFYKKGMHIYQMLIAEGTS